MKKKLLMNNVFIVSFILITLVMVLVPTEATATSWTAYGFTIAALILSAIVWNVKIANDKTLKSKFMGLALTQVVGLYLVIQIILFVVLKFVTIELWIAILLMSILLGVTVILVSFTEISIDSMNAREERVQTKVSTIRNLEADLNLLAQKTSDLNRKALISKLAEAIRFSDPMSDSSLNDLESEIKLNVEAIASLEGDDQIVHIEKVEMLIIERNTKTRLLK